MSNLSIVELEEELNKVLGHVREIYKIAMDLPQQSNININTKLAIEHDSALTEILGITEEALFQHGGV